MPAEPAAVPVRDVAGSSAAIHQRDPWASPAESAEVWHCLADAAALVLGSGQDESVVDRQACVEHGITLTRRRSGGGAVLVVPANVAWIDLIVPVGLLPDDIRDDVRAAMIWAGERWREAIAAAAPEHDRRFEVHHGAMVTAPWSALWCFAGVGPGEIVSDGAKLVGLSQRRTRHGVRIQGMLHRSPSALDPAALFEPRVRPEGRPPAPATLALDPTSLAAALSEAVAEALRRR